MVARGPGDVGCAHCTRIGADRSCPVCTHLVCAACAADWTTCSEPSGRVVRLGLTARLRDVDPSGRLGLVSHWRQPLRIFDLRRLRWIENIRLSRHLWLFARSAPPRLTSDGSVLHVDISSLIDDTARLDTGIARTRLAGNASLALPSEWPTHGTAVTAVDDIFYYLTDSQRVALLRRDAMTTELYEPLPRKVLHSAYLDADRMLLAAGSWSELTIHHILDGKLELGLHAKPEATGDVSWIALAGPWLALAVRLFGGSIRIEVRRFEEADDAGAIGHRRTLSPILHRYAASTLRAASLSSDGRYLALALDHGLLVQELGTENATTFEDHTDEINLVRFVGHDHVLVSADTDNRVILRPRTPTGYARPLVTIDVPVETVGLPTLA